MKVVIDSLELTTDELKSTQPVERITCINTVTIISIVQMIQENVIRDKVKGHLDKKELIKGVSMDYHTLQSCNEFEVKQIKGEIRN